MECQKIEACAEAQNDQIYGAHWACLLETLYMPESGSGRMGSLHQWRVIWSEGLSFCKHARLLCVPG